MEFFGKATPGFMKLYTKHKEKRAEEKEMRETLKASKIALEENNRLFKEIDRHYDKDNISHRNLWMDAVDKDRANLHALEGILIEVRRDV